MSDEFYVCISGPFGPTYQFDLRENRVYYGFSTQNLQTERSRLPELEHQPNQENIDSFWDVVKGLGLQDWESEYINREIAEGPRWELCMSSDGRENCYRGIAAFPGCPHPTYSQDFLKLIAAVRQLLGWMPFG